MRRGTLVYPTQYPPIINIHHRIAVYHCRLTVVCVCVCVSVFVCVCGDVPSSPASFTLRGSTWIGKTEVCRATTSSLRFSCSLPLLSPTFFLCSSHSLCSHHSHITSLTPSPAHPDGLQPPREVSVSHSGQPVFPPLVTARQLLQLLILCI